MSCHVADQVRARMRAEDLTTIRGRHEARGAVDRAAVVVAVAYFGKACTDPHPHTQRLRRLPRLRSQLELRGDGCLESVGRGRERGMDPVARRLNDKATV